MGVYGASTFQQGQTVTPSAHPAPATSQCTKVATIGSGIKSASIAASSSASSVSSAALHPKVTTVNTPAHHQLLSFAKLRTLYVQPPSPVRAQTSTLPHSSTLSAGHAAGNGADSLFGRELEIAIAGAAVVAAMVV